MRILLRIQNKSANFNESVIPSFNLNLKTFFPFETIIMKMAFFTNVIDLQAALGACLTARVFRSVSHALNSTFKPRFAYKLERDSSTIEITTIEVRSAN